MDKPLSVTYEFVIEFTDYVEFDWPLMSRESAREALWQILYQGEKHQAFTLNFKEGD